MTNWSDIITAAMQIIDDDRWRNELAVNAAQFYRAKSGMVRLALPLLSKPPELLEHLEKFRTDPTYGEYIYKSSCDAKRGDSVIVNTELTDFDICTVSVRSKQGTENFHVPVLDYDAEAGDVSIILPVDGAAEYSFDFYKDGEFPDLTDAQMRLFALAVAVTWDERFQRDWLSNTMKLKDASFETVNESNYMEKTNSRYLANRQSLEDSLRSYEQQCAYSTIVGGNRSIKLV